MTPRNASSASPLSPPPSRLYNGNITRRSPHSISETPCGRGRIQSPPSGTSPQGRRMREWRWDDVWFRIIPRWIGHPKQMFWIVLVVIFPVAWIRLDGSILRKMDSPQSSHNEGLFLLPSLLPFVVDSTLFRDSELATLGEHNQDVPPSQMESFYPSLHQVVPKSVYKPKSSNPLQVIYVGKRASNNSQTDELLDALQRSLYTKVSSIFLYDSIMANQGPPKLRHEQWHVWDPSAPMALLVDWSALSRDCHILYRILSHLHFYFRDTENYFILLLDASASPNTVTCSRVLDPLVRAPDRIRWAKRSIVQGRHWNNTRQWIEPGSLISQSKTTTNILHWTGQVSEAFYRSLRHALTGAANDRPHIDQNRPVDVAHYWMASTVSLVPYHFYYNRLRCTVFEQLQRTRARSFRNEDSATYWMELVGPDSVVEEVSPSGSADAAETDAALFDAAPSSIYAAWLASSKIVVVTQADEWEDHDDRLMEALASGALVLCDSMVAPVRGLIHKTNIVFFDNPKELDRYLIYYLDPKNEAKRKTIGRHGMEFALGRHRSWHLLEALLFGKALTKTDRRLLLEVDLPLRPPTIKDPPILIAL
jgi:Glycosyl transferases group 1